MRDIDDPLSEAEIGTFVQTFDHMSPTYAKNPFDIYRYMRRHFPVLHSDAWGGFWIPTRYEDIVQIVHDDETFTSSGGPSIPQFHTPTHPIDMDPPLTQKWRAFLLPLLSPSALAAMESEINALARSLVDAFIGRGKADLVRELARPLTTLTTLRLAGLEEDNAMRISDIVHQGIVGETDPQTQLANTTWLENEVKRQIRAQREVRKPRGVISHMIYNCTIDGRKLTDDEIWGTINLFLAGGVDTTQAALGIALRYIDDHPAVRERIMGGNFDWTSMIEEFIRYVTPAQNLARTATRDCVIGGKTIKKGERVLIPWAAGNWDESEFPEPDKLDIDRFPNRHIAFGVGVHRCLGSNVARLMFRAGLNEVMTRLPDYRVVPGAVSRARACGIVYCYKSLPVTFTPRAA